MTSSEARAIVLVGCLAAVSCLGCGRVASDAGRGGDGGGGAAGGAAGASGTTSGGSAGTGNTAGAGPACIDPVGSCPASRYEQWQVLLDAADFGDSARFVALGGRAVLVDTGTGFRAVDVFDPEMQEASGEAYTAWAVPDVAGTPVAVAELFDSGSTWRPTVVVLVCREAGTGCSLLRGGDQTDELSPWTSSELPRDFVARGMVVDNLIDSGSAEPTLTEPRLCVYGNGLLCWRDGWQAEIPVVADLRLNHVSFHYWSLAVGEEGRWYKREVDDAGVWGSWEEQPPLGSASLTFASTAWFGGVIVGEGSIQAALGEQSDVYGCAVPRDLAALMLRPWGPSDIAVTWTGEVLKHRPWTALEPDREPYCSLQQLTAGAIVAIDTAICGDSMNPRVLFESALMGTNLCFHID